MLPVLVALQLLVVTGQPALHVPVAADASLPCAANKALRSTIALRLPSVRLGAGQPEPDDLIASLGRIGTVWWFEVKRPSGAVAMSRALMTDSDCPQLADTAALILDRYMSDIDWRGRPVGIDLAPAPAPAPVVKAPPVERPPSPPPPRKAVAPSAVASAPDLPAPAVTLGQTGRSGTQVLSGESGLETGDVAVGTSTRSNVAAHPPDPAPPAAVVANAEPTPVPTVTREPPPKAPEAARLIPRFSLSVGGGGWFGIPTDAAGSLSLEVAVLLFERVRLALLFAGGTPFDRAVENRGSMRVQSFIGLATASFCGGRRFTGCGGIAGGAQLTTGAISSTPATGQRLYQAEDQLLVLGVLGLHGRLALALYGPLELSADLSVLFPLGSGGFTIEGFTSPTWTTAPVELLAGLRLGWKFF